MSNSVDFSLLDYDFSNGNKKLRLTLTYFNGIPKIDIREFYLDKKEQKFKHSRKGIQLDPQKAEAIRAALGQNSKIIDKHLLSEDLQNWASDVKEIKTSADFFSHFDFFKTISKGSKEEIILNSNHPFSKRIIEIEKKIDTNKLAGELLELLKILLICYNNSLSQFNDQSKITVEDFVFDQNQIWSSLLKRVLKP